MTSSVINIEPAAKWALQEKDKEQTLRMALHPHWDLAGGAASLAALWSGGKKGCIWRQYDGREIELAQQREEMIIAEESAEGAPAKR